MEDVNCKLLAVPEIISGHVRTLFWGRIKFPTSFVFWSMVLKRIFEELQPIFEEKKVRNDYFIT